MANFNVEGAQNVEISKKIPCEKPLIVQLEIMERYTAVHKACAAHAPRTDLHAGRDAQAAGALRPHEALMPREAEDADVHALHVDGEHARRLRRVDHEQKPVRGAEIADPLQVKQVSRQVRACRAHHGLRLWPQQTFKVRMIDPALPVGGQEVRLHAPLHLPV